MNEVLHQAALDVALDYYGRLKPYYEPELGFIAPILENGYEKHPRRSSVIRDDGWGRTCFKTRDSAVVHLYTLLPGPPRVSIVARLKRHLKRPLAKSSVVAV